MALFIPILFLLWQFVVTTPDALAPTQIPINSPSTVLPFVLSSTNPETALPATTSAIDQVQTPPDHWQPERPDPFVCEYLGENNCWQPSELLDGPPYMGPLEWPQREHVCNVVASNDSKGDDTSAVLRAFSDCKTNGHIIFANTTYHIGTVMNTTGLLDVDIELRGTLLWSSDIRYWLANSLPIGFQNQTSAWHLGGENIHFYGHGYGTLNGNGQVWYDYNNGQSNLHGRPHAITITDTKNSVIEGLNFYKSQMWTMTVARSEKVLLQNIYVNNTSSNSSPNINTDGADTVYANNITFLNWIVDNGDDAISMKQNSTNIYISNCTFHNGEALAMGSIGQYPDQIEIIENVTATNIRVVNSGHAGRVKTWTGLNKGDAPNGGGGGIGRVRNITFTDFVLQGVRTAAWSIQQCISYNGQPGDCGTSRLQVEDIHWGDAKGTLASDKVALLQCSEMAPCEGIELFKNAITVLGRNDTAATYLCDNVLDPKGFVCTGPCDGNINCPSN